MKISARVVSGRGAASHLRSGDLSAIESQHRIRLIPGSLNLVGKSPIWLRSEAAFFASGVHYFWHARLFDHPVVLNRWAVRCPVHLYEIFADEHLRSKFSLSDGDSVELSIAESAIDSNVNFIKHAMWYAVWRGRESLIYHDGVYRRLVYDRRMYWIVKNTFHDPATRQARNGQYVR